MFNLSLSLAILAAISSREAKAGFSTQAAIGLESTEYNEDYRNEDAISVVYEANTNY